MNFLSLIIVLAGLLIGEGSLGLAYEVRNVEAGGTIRGTVTLKGAAPFPKAYNLITFPDPEYCGRISDGNGWRLLKDFVVNNRNQLQGVVMVVEGLIYTNCGADFRCPGHPLSFAPRKFP